MSFQPRFPAAYAALNARAMEVAKSAAAGAAALPSAGYLPTLGSTPSASGLFISQGTSMAVAAVYACVTTRAQDVARCAPILYRRDATGKRVVVTDHPVARFFRRPNPYQTWFEFCEQITAAKLLRGNGYAVMRHDGRGRLRDMIPVNPDAVLVLEGFDGMIFYNVNRIGLWQIAMLRDFPSSIAAEDMFHLRDLTFNSLVALSTIGMARDAIGLAMGLEQQGSRLMQNGSRPSVVLQAKGRLGKEAAERLKQQWRDLTAGLQNVGATAVLEEGIEAKPMQLTSVDLEYMAQRNFQVQDVCRFYRMPPYKLGLVELRGINIDQINADYVQNTVMIDLHRWEQKLTQVFNLDEQGLEVAFDETVLLRADITTRYTAARIALGGAAFMSVNEVRAGEKQPPIEGGDEITRPVNMATLGSDITGTAPDGAGHPAAAEGGVSGADNVSEAEPINASQAAQEDNEAANSVGRAARALAKAGLPL